MDELTIQVIALYLVIINLVSIIVCKYDKNAARKRKGRVSEKSLFLLCFVGGSPAMYICMRVIRHKTKHKRFMIGIPIIIILQIAIVFLWFYFKIL